MELELKLLCSESVLKGLASHALLARWAVAPPERNRLESIYFDTPDFFLRAHGYGLRVRRVGRRWVQTLKGGGNARGGFHAREEWEMPVASESPDLDALMRVVGASSAQGVLLGESGLGGRLEEVFRTVFQRKTWLLEVPSQTGSGRRSAAARVEVAMDRGELRVGECTEPISELELELKAGEPSVLFRVASELLQQVPFRLGRESKAARGYALRGIGVPEVRKAGKVCFSPKLSAEGAFEVIWDGCLAQVQENELGVSRGSEVESVHQMRVGLRRLRCALRFFGPVIAFPEELLGELKWLADCLGGARDWEVLATETLAVLARARPPRRSAGVSAGGSPTEEPGDALVLAAWAEAESQRSFAREAVDSERYARLSLALGEWRHRNGQGGIAHSAPSGTKERVGQKPVGVWANRLLARLFKKLLSRGASLVTASVEERHRVRIAAKRLRYACEFFEGLYPSARMERFVSRLKALQEALGWLNDVSVGAGLLEKLAVLRPELSPEAQYALGWFEGRSGEDIRELGRQWKRLAGSPPPWEE